MREEPRCNRTPCGHKSCDEEDDAHLDAPFPFVGCATVIAMAVVAGILLWAWSHGSGWKGVAG